MNTTVSRETEILYVGREPQLPVERPETPPIYPSTANIISDMDDYDRANKGEKYYYCRTANPNRDGVAQAVSYLEHGEQSLVCSSGMAAISTTILSLVKAGDHIITSNAIYGETIELFDRIVKKFGVEVTYVDLTDPDAVEQAVQKNTRLIYTEIITNPLIRIIDIDAITRIAHKAGALVVVDSTFTTPFAICPLDHGADIVVHSMTKYFGGHSDITAGCITGPKELMKKIYSDYLLFGGCLDPQSSWLLLRSIRTMEMRVTRQFANARALACGATAASTVVATLTSKNLKNDEEPASWYKVFWAFLVLLLPVGILFLEHMVPGLNVLTTIQSVTTIMAIPLSAVIVLLLVTFYKTLRKDIRKKELYVDDVNKDKWNAV